MSNLRISCLNYIASNGGELIPVDQIADALAEHPSRVKQAMSDAKKDDLVTFGRDEITRQGGYSLTAKGHARVVAGKMQFNGKTQAENLAEKPTETEVEPQKINKGQILFELLKEHGSMDGATLAKMARDAGHDIPAKNVPALMVTKIKYGLVRARPYQGSTWYEAISIDSDSAGHVMSAPPAESRENELQEKLNIALKHNSAANDLLAELEQITHCARQDLIARIRQLIAQPTPIPTRPALGYMCVMDADDLQIHPDEESARKEAEGYISAAEIGLQVHVVAVLASAELAVNWR